MPNQLLHPLRHALGCAVSLTCLGLLSVSMSAQAQVVSESPEIVYSGTDVQPLYDKATQLGTAVAIYEHVHNSIKFSPYHGSRSGAVNTFMGQRGSDVDIASTLIAMLRSQKIPARYAVGTVRIPAEQLTNWLGVPQLDTAVQVLKDQGIQGVTLAGDRSTVDFEHAWAEAFVPFDQYRGINTVSPAVDCSQAGNASRCTWVALDGSFKQKTYNGLNLDPYNAVQFDYDAYYNAIKNNDATRRDKNPLAILEDQIGVWLRTNYPGKTLDDVEDAGQIIPVREGLLPASLPYQVVGNVRRYDTVALHDAVVTGTEAKKWGKRLTISAKATVNFSGGGTITLGGAAGGGLLAELSTKRLTITTEFSGTNKTPQIVTRLDGVELARPIVGSTSLSPSIGGQLTITLSMDGAPSVTSGVADRTIDATYSGTIGGYYLIATGGESSNWSQVHRAAAQLLAANDKYKIVFNAAEVGCLPDGVNCTPYVDANMNGWDASDTKLLETKDAMDGLTGGLLNVAALQYYSKLRDQYQRADGLMKTKTPVIGFLGVVSSVYEAEYVDGTAFSILPGGLLIDMKGITVGGSYRTNEGAVARSNRQFEFLGHVGSSLEHETWQELTGYDAISTVRGIQMALANGGSLQKARKNATEDTMPAVYPFLGFNTTVPDGFTFVPYTIFSTAPATWSHATSGASFETIQGTVTASTTTAQRGSAIYRYLPTGGLYGWSKCVAKNIADISVYPSSQAIQWNTCIGSSYYERVSTILQYINNEWNNPIIVSYTGREDDGSGLYHYRARYYDTTIGRFISEDPKGFGAGINFYAYVGNNPINANDPSGLVEANLIPIYSQAKAVWGWASGKYDQAIKIANNVLQEQAPAVALRLANGDSQMAARLLWNGQADAWRHAEWNRQMASDPKVGPTFAAIAGYGHEAVNLKDKLFGNGAPNQSWNQFTKEILMDLSNNSLGRTRSEQGVNVVSPFDSGLTFGTGGSQGQPNIGFAEYFKIGGGANGGFLLYPNKPNNNMMQAVYNK